MHLRLKQILSRMLEPFAELTALGRLTALGLLVLCVCLPFSATQIALSKAFPYLAGLVVAVGIVAAIGMWRNQRRLNPAAKMFDVGSPFMWALDAGLFCAVLAAVSIGSLTGYVSAGFAIVRSVWRCV